MCYEAIQDDNTIGYYVFLGCQIRIYVQAFKNGGITFKNGLNYKTNKNFELNGGEREFRIKIYEVVPQ